MSIRSKEDAIVGSGKRLLATESNGDDGENVAFLGARQRRS